MINFAEKEISVNNGYFRNSLAYSPKCESKNNRHDVVLHIDNFYLSDVTPFSAVNGPGVVMAFNCQLSLTLLCLMIIIHYMFITCGCTRIA